jgi:hypothetical protein
MRKFLAKAIGTFADLLGVSNSWAFSAISALVLVRPPGKFLQRWWKPALALCAVCVLLGLAAAAKLSGPLPMPQAKSRPGAVQLMTNDGLSIDREGPDIHFNIEDGVVGEALVPDAEEEWTFQPSARSLGSVHKVVEDKKTAAIGVNVEAWTSPTQRLRFRLLAGRLGRRFFPEMSATDGSGGRTILESSSEHAYDFSEKPDRVLIWIKYDGVRIYVALQFMRDSRALSAAEPDYQSFRRHVLAYGWAVSGIKRIVAALGAPGSKFDLSELWISKHHWQTEIDQ